MLSDLGSNALWNEPLVGALFGEFYLNHHADRRTGAFIMAPSRRDAWLPAVRGMVLRGAAKRFPNLPREGYLIVKEPNGYLGAPLLSAAMPESRLVFVLRDPRDVVASGLDAQRAGGWTADLQVWKGVEKPVQLADTDPEAFVRDVAELYLKGIQQVERAYLAHAGPKAMVKYEALRASPKQTMLELCSKLEFKVQDDELTKAVEGRAWEKIPPEQKGDRQFFRKATPGAWVEDLSVDQARIVEDVTAPVLTRFYAEVHDVG